MFYVQAVDFFSTCKSIILLKNKIDTVEIWQYFHIEKHLFLKLSRNTKLRCGKEGVKFNCGDQLGDGS